MPLQFIIILGTVLAFAGLAFMMSRSIKKHDARPKGKIKKGRLKYMPQSKNAGR